MSNIRSHGSIPMVTWEPWLYPNGVDQPAYSLQTIASGAFDSYIGFPGSTPMRGLYPGDHT
jgi:hypothetical protein